MTREKVYPEGASKNSVPLMMTKWAGVLTPHASVEVATRTRILPSTNSLSTLERSCSFSPAWWSPIPKRRVSRRFESYKCRLPSNFIHTLSNLSHPSAVVQPRKLASMSKHLQTAHQGEQKYTSKMMDDNTADQRINRYGTEECLGSP